MRRNRAMFMKPRRRPWAIPLAVVFVVVAAVGTYLLLSRPAIEIHGTMTAIAPLACRDDSRVGFTSREVVFRDDSGKELGRANPTGVQARTERVRGFAHCRMVGTYEVRLPRAASYVVVLPDQQLTVATVSLDQLRAAGFRYDIVA